MQNHDCEPLDRAQAVAAGGEALISRWLDALLCEGLAFSEDDRDEEREFKIAAAREAMARLLPEGAGLAERMQAVQYLCAFQAGQLALAEANSPYLPGEQRTAARRFARQAMALTSRQLALLDRLGRERQVDQLAARFQAGKDRQGASAPLNGWAEAAAGDPATPAAAPPESRQQRRARERRERKALKRLAGAA